MFSAGRNSEHGRANNNNTPRKNASPFLLVEKCTNPKTIWLNVTFVV